jgi:hypothetical protein
MRSRFVGLLSCGSSISRCCSAILFWKLFDQGRLSPMGALFARGLKPGLSVAEASKKQYLLF